MNEQQILDLLIAAGVCSGNIFPSVAPSATALPHGRYSVIKTPHSNTLRQTHAYRIRFNLSIWGSTYNSLKTIEALIRTTLISSGYEIFSTISNEEETGYQRLETNWYFIET